jgi:glycosyltransferase involved in cell wall biosynthesis
MRLAVHDYAGHPFQVQLSRKLAERGCDVLHLHFSQLETPKGAVAPRDDDPATFEVEGLTLDKPYEKYSFAKRTFQDRSYGRVVAERIVRFRPDAVISGNTPIDGQHAILEACRNNDIPFVFWLQDVYGLLIEKVLARKLPIVGLLAGKYYRRLERRLLGSSQAVVCVSDDFLPLLKGYGVAAERTHVVENWAPLDEITPVDADNDWSRSHALAGKKTIMYSGTLGLKHNPALLLELAARFRHRDDVAIVVVSEGLGADWLKSQKVERGLDNLVLLPFQPYHLMSEVLSSATILVAVLEPSASSFSVPSKVLSYLCVGRPLVLAVPRENLAARTVLHVGAGVTIGPDDTEGFLAQVERLLEDEEQCARIATNARRYAAHAFDIETIADRFERVFESATQRRAQNRATRSVWPARREFAS